MDLSDVDVTDILALIDSLPYDELDLRTGRFRLILRRTPDGWTRSTQVLSALETALPGPEATGTMSHRGGYNRTDVTSCRSESEASGTDGISGTGGELVAVRAPLPGTFYRAPRPGAAPFVEVGSRVSADTVIGIVETMKLMNSVPAGVAGTVAEFCLANAEFAAHGATLMRIRADP